MYGEKRRNILKKKKIHTQKSFRFAIAFSITFCVAWMRSGPSEMELKMLSDQLKRKRESETRGKLRWGKRRRRSKERWGEDRGVL